MHCLKQIPSKTHKIFGLYYKDISFEIPFYLCVSNLQSQVTHGNSVELEI